MSELSPRSPHDWRPIVIAIGIFAALSIAAGITSQGFLEADSCTHYLYARFAFAQPHYFINIWGRPICTGIYAIPAVLGGRFGVHLMSLTLAIGCGLLAYRIAANQGYRWPALALIFTLAQPLVFLHSFSELTELPFAFLLGLAFWMYQTRRFFWMALLIGLSPLSRPEGFGFLVLAAIALIVHRRWWWLIVLAIPLVAWSYAGWIMYGCEGHWWSWLVDNWPYAPTSLYLKGPLLFWLHRPDEVAFSFLLRLPVVLSPFVFPFFVVGAWRGLSCIPLRRDHMTWCGVIITLLPLAMLAGHSVLWWRGLMASNGELRYLLIAAPFWGLISAKGLEWVFQRLRWMHPLIFSGIVSLLPIAANFIYPVIPLKTYEDWDSAHRVADWYQHSGIAAEFPKVSVAHPAFFYFMDIPINGDKRCIDWRQDTLAHAPNGTVLVYDPVYSIFNSDARRKVTLDDLAAMGFIDVTDHVPAVGSKWHVLLTPRDVHGRAVDVQALQRYLSPP